MGNHFKKPQSLFSSKTQPPSFQICLENKTYEMLYEVLVFHMFGLDYVKKAVFIYVSKICEEYNFILLHTCAQPNFGSK